MFVLNTTFVTHESINADFLKWVREVYIPTARQSGIFGEPTVARVLARMEPDTESIAVQMTAENLAEAEDWLGGAATELYNNLHARWGERLMFFSTFMQHIPMD